MIECEVEEYEPIPFWNPIPDILLDKYELILYLIKRECIEPILQSKDKNTILLKLPKFVFLYTKISIKIAKEIDKNPDMIASMKNAIKECDLFASLEEDKKKVTDKYIFYNFHLLEKILKTKPEKLVYVNRYAMMEICEKSFLPVLLILCYEEAVKREKATLSFIEKEMIEAMQDYISSMKSLLKEWDVLTDILTMKALEENERARIDTGEPLAGSTGFYDLMNHLSIEKGNPSRICKVRNICELDISPIDLEVFLYEDYILKFKEKISLFPKLSEDQQIMYLVYEPIGIDVYGSNHDELEEEIHEQIHFLWEEYAMVDENDMTDNAKKMKRNLLAMIEKIG